MRRIFLALFLFVHALAFCRRGDELEVFEKEEGVEPWFTGPLISASGYVTPIGYYDVEPYLFVTDYFGRYDNHWHAQSVPNVLSINPLLFFSVGLSPSIDLQSAPQFYYTRSGGRATIGFGDLPLGLDFQLIKDSPDHWWPAVKLGLIELFPIGKYQNLDPKKNGADILGGGSYVTTIALAASRIYEVGNAHFLDIRFNVQYGIHSPVRVHNLNAYGGGAGTRGTVYPGNTLTAIFGMQYNFTRNWAFACDLVNTYGGKTRFRGKSGAIDNNARFQLGGSWFDQVSLAPAIEYNFSASFGIIAGAWFTVAGRNANQFASAVIAFNWYNAFP